MRNRLEQRLAELRNELMVGQKMSNELDVKRAELQTTMLRIAGAIQVIEEVLQTEIPPPPSRLASPSNGVEVAAG